MSQFDLDGVVEAAKKNVEEADSGGGDYKYDLFYPYKEGVVSLRILYNPASNNAMRKIQRHKVNDVTNPCLQQYGKECKTCKAVEKAENAKEVNLWKLKATTRGLSFAQFVESDYPEGADTPSRGEVVLFMYPYTVYKDLSEIIAQAGSNASSLLTENEGMIVKVKRTRSNDRVEYKALTDPFGKFVSVDKKGNTSEENQKAFQEMLLELDDLNDMILPSEYKDEFAEVDMELAKSIEEEYLADQTGKAVEREGVNLGSKGSDVEKKSSKDLDSQVPSEDEIEVAGADESESGSKNKKDEIEEAKNSDDSLPDCYGQHGSDAVSEQKCLICPHEIECEEVSS